MTKYNAGITGQKTAIAAGTGIVGVIIETVVHKLLPGWFESGMITGAVMTVWAGVSNWRKNK